MVRMADDNCKFLQLKNCPRCAYSIEGLPRRGRCPECGFSYDQDMRLLPIMLHRWRPSKSARTILSVLVAFSATMTVIAFINGPIPIFLIFVTCIGFLPLITNWRTRSLKHFKERQLAILLSASGMALRKRSRLLTRCPWECFDQFSLKAFESGIWQLKLRPSDWRRTLAPTIDVDILLGEDSEIGTSLRCEIKRWTEVSRANASNALASLREK